MRVGEDVEDLLGRAAQAGAQGGHDDGAVEEDGVLLDEGEQLVVRPLGVAEVQFGERGAFFAQDFANAQAHGAEELAYLGGAGGCLEVLDDHRFDAAVADEGQGVARGATGGVVVDRDGVGHGAGVGLGRETSGGRAGVSLRMGSVRLSWAARR